MVFKFRLEKVLTLRKEAVEEAQRQVNHAQKELIRAQKALDDNILEIKQRNEDLIKNNYNMAQDHLRVIKAMHDQQKVLKSDLENAQYQLQKARNDLIEAQMKLEALEKLKEKQSEEYYLEQNRIEQKETDEKVTLKYASEMLKKYEED